MQTDGQIGALLGVSDKAPMIGAYRQGYTRAERLRKELPREPVALLKDKLNPYSGLAENGKRCKLFHDAWERGFLNALSD